MSDSGYRRPRPGEHVYDPCTERIGVLQSVHGVEDLLFDPEVEGKRIAFLRPVGGGIEWTADADGLRFPVPDGVRAPARATGAEPLLGRE
ncbi:hypothetical protein AAHZ94_04540 [Streptomyces sp. HSW2009]|uniref:hypothetical protein n=1 Tax=Streptomyces sp. HSW2009 TaxID=3142890 RepID=UPI0032EDD247